MAESTRHAVLGLVAREPAHGYAIFAELESWPVSASLRPSRSTVYRHLERLHATGLVAAQEDATELPVGTRRPDRTVFAATHEGHTQLDRIAQTPPRDFDELTMRVGIARPQDLPLLITYATRLERESLDRFQQWSMLPEPCVIAARQRTPWRSVTRTLQAKMQAADAASLATILEQISADLGELRRTVEASRETT